MAPARAMRYRRSTATGGTFFFTVNLQDRSADLLVRHVELLRTATRKVRMGHPFDIVATAVMSEHVHAIWRLPENDADFSMRWSLIKGAFSRALPPQEFIGNSRSSKRERGIWQRRYWEHQIRDERDLERHVDYIHYNPVKHGHVARPIDWPHSSLHRYVRQGIRSEDWGADMPSRTGKFGERK